MHKAILIFSFLFSFSSIIAQGWEFHLKKAVSLFPKSVVELKDQKIAIGIIENDFGDTLSNSLIVILSAEGQLIDSLDLTANFVGHRFVLGGLSTIDDKLWVLGHAIDSLNQYMPAMLALDSNATIVWDSLYTNHLNCQFEIIEYYTQTRNYVSGYSKYLSWNLNTVWELDSSFQIMDTYVDSTKLFLNECQKIFDTNAGALYCSNIDQIRKVVLSPFSISDTFAFGLHSSTQYAYPRSQPFRSEFSSVLIPGFYDDITQPLSKEKLHISELNSDLTFKKSRHYDLDSVDMVPAYYKSLSQIENHYYLGGTYNVNSSDFIFDKADSSSFILLKLDTTLNLIWSKKFKNDMRYSLYNVITSGNSGVIMVGTRWNWIESPVDKIAELYAVKVDSSGNYSGIPRFDESAQFVWIYPNPSSGELSIETNDANGLSSIELFEMTGKRIFQKSFNHQTAAHFNLPPTIKNGIYVIKMHGTNIHTKRLVLCRP